MTSFARQVRGSCTIAVALLVMAACAREEKGPNGELALHGTVHMVQGQDSSTCWKFVSNKGKDYELQPAQVPRALLVDGMQAKMFVKPRKGGGSFCNVGEVVDVVKVDSMAAPGATASR